MKNKTLAGILALLFGGFGVHRFYLGQTGLGIAYLLFTWTGIPWLIGLIDAIVLLSMSQGEFDHKYNWRYMDEYYHTLETDYERRRYEEYRRNEARRRRQPPYRRSYERRASERPSFNSPPPPPRRPAPPLVNPHKEKGIQKFKDYDFDGAIAAFEKALEVNPKDIAVHFNLACAYSINECSEDAFYHLDKAVEYGFQDVERIESHDALAYLRIQEEYENFKENGFRLTQNAGVSEKNIPQNENLLDQLQKLADLREKGLLTEEEFDLQKRRLLD